MADNTLDILIRFKNEKIGADEAVAELNKIKAAGTEATDELVKGSDKATEGVKLFNVHGKEMGKLIHTAGEIAPGLGLALRAAFHPANLGLVALVMGIKSTIEQMEEARKSGEEFVKIFEQGIDTSSLSGSGEALKTIMVDAGVAADTYLRKIEAIKTSQESLKSITDNLIADLKLQFEQQKALADAQLAAEEARIKADPKLSDQEKAARLNDLRGQAGATDLKRNRDERAAELDSRRIELGDARRDAGGLASRRETAEAEFAQANRTEKLRQESIASHEKEIEKMKQAVEARKEWLKKEEERTGWDPTSFKQRAARQSIASDEATIAKLQEALKTIKSPETEERTKGNLAKATEARDQARADEEANTQRIRELETEIPRMEERNKRADANEAQIAVERQRAANFTTAGEINAANTRDSAAQDRERRTFLASPLGKSLATAGRNDGSAEEQAAEAAARKSISSVEALQRIERILGIHANAFDSALKRLDDVERRAASLASQASSAHTP